jgi:hypothetical protein
MWSCANSLIRPLVADPKAELLDAEVQSKSVIHKSTGQPLTALLSNAYLEGHF